MDSKVLGVTMYIVITWIIIEEKHASQNQQMLLLTYSYLGIVQFNKFWYLIINLCNGNFNFYSMSIPTVFTDFFEIFIHKSGYELFQTKN